uniref:Uncharacterized protein n=1 Tax=Rhizophagus irregularis (strain DAOM 181602 / DAOM 197198 / MUCL 43194) TaxID=747089 RepID=U9T8H4_RHIID
MKKTFRLVLLPIFTGPYTIALTSFNSFCVVSAKYVTFSISETSWCKALDERSIKNTLDTLQLALDRHVPLGESETCLQRKLRYKRKKDKGYAYKRFLGETHEVALSLLRNDCDPNKCTDFLDKKDEVTDKNSIFSLKLVKDI